MGLWICNDSWIPTEFTNAWSHRSLSPRHLFCTSCNWCVLTKGNYGSRDRGIVQIFLGDPNPFKGSRGSFSLRTCSGSVQKKRAELYSRFYQEKITWPDINPGISSNWTDLNKPQTYSIWSFIHTFLYNLVRKINPQRANELTNPLLSTTSNALAMMEGVGRWPEMIRQNASLAAIGFFHDFFHVLLNAPKLSFQWDNWWFTLIYPIFWSHSGQHGQHFSAPGNLYWGAQTGDKILAASFWGHSSPPHQPPRKPVS